jgi:pimeloyl-ACP methyl ester carboxylesterase
MREVSGGFVEANGTRIFFEEFGDESQPLMLLLAGATNSLDWWDERLCWLLADGGFRVVRFDYRDTGQSSHYPVGAPGYDFDELVGDCVAMINGLGVDRAHLVGCSMGSGIAQRVAVDRPDVVSSLALFSTTPGMRPGARSRPGLPPPSSALRERMQTADPVDWSDRSIAIEKIVDGARLFAGPTTAGDEYFQRLAVRVFDRTTNMAASMTNHWRMRPGPDYGQAIERIQAPTLVLHGTEDPLFPFEHAEALAASIAHSNLVPLQGVGHEMPPEQTWPLVVPQLLALAGG